MSEAENSTGIAVHSIRIPTPFAVGDVFAYLLVDEKVVLVDTGPRTEQALKLVRDHLNRRGLELRSIDEIWLTHGHPDHFGQARFLAECSGARLRGHPLERENFAATDNSEQYEEFFVSRGIPARYIEGMIEQLHWLQQFQQPVEPEWVCEGDGMSTGTLSFKVGLTPGHAPGHVVYFSNSGIMFGGDLLLEDISTNALINFNPDTGERNKSLLQYRHSLKWLRKQRGVVYPGHGKMIKRVRAVADHHLAEHRRRYGEICRLVKERPMTLMELSRRLFPKAVEKGDAFLVLSEVLGYLDWGIEEGRIYFEEQRRQYVSA